MVTAEGHVSFSQLDQRTDQLAAGLHEAGLHPGDPVLFQVTNRLHTILAWYGALKAHPGRDPRALHRRHEISQIAARTGAVAHLVEVNPDDKFDLVAMAGRTAGTASTARHVLTVGTPEARPGYLCLKRSAPAADPAA